MSEINSPHPPENNSAGDLSEFGDLGTRVKIIGVGGAGANAIENLNLENFPDVRKAIINTEAAALRTSRIEEKILIGRNLTRGLSAGGDAALGLKAAEADCDAIARAVENTDLIFLVTGLGRGTGSGASQLVADIAARKGAMIIAFVTMPFSFEGGRIGEQAVISLGEIRLRCEAVFPLYNDSLMQVVNTDDSALNAFAQADAWIHRGIRSLCSAILKTGLINIDFNSLRSAFPARGGRTLYTLGAGSGPDAVQDAVTELLNSPLLQARETVRNADTLVVHIMSGAGLTLAKANEIVTRISGKLGGRNSTMLGVSIDAAMGDAVEICVIGSAGGFKQRRATVSASTDTVGASIQSDDVSDEPSPTPQKTPAKLGDKINYEQSELGLDEMEAQRGFFDKTKPSMLEGQSIDTPTYIRRGIKILL